MPNSWKSDYLLNIISVSRVDGEIKPIEVLWLSRVKERIRGTKMTLADAVIRSHLEKLKPIDTIIGNEKCLRDMIVMAIIDGPIHKKEQEIIDVFIDRAKISKRRISSIVKDALNSMSMEKECIVGTIRL